MLGIDQRRMAATEVSGGLMEYVAEQLKARVIDLIERPCGSMIPKDVSFFESMPIADSVALVNDSGPRLKSVPPPLIYRVCVCKLRLRIAVGVA